MRPAHEAAGRNGATAVARTPDFFWRTFDLNLLVVFDSVAAERSITRASLKLNMTQSAVSHALTRLRGALGDELFLRTATGVEPTPFAAALTEPIHAALGVVQAALTSPAFDPALARRDFAVAMDNRSALVLAAPLAAGVAREAPRVSLDLRPTGLLEIAEQLDRGGVDVAVTCVEIDDNRLRSSPLFEDGFALVARRDHPAATDDTVDLAALAAYPHLSLSSVSEDASFVDEHLARQGRVRQIAIRAPLHAAGAILTGSDMLMVVGEKTARAFARGTALQVLALPFEPPRTTTSMLWHRRWDRAPAHRWLRETIRRAVEDACA